MREMLPVSNDMINPFNAELNGGHGSRAGMDEKTN